MYKAVLAIVIITTSICFAKDGKTENKDKKVSQQQVLPQVDNFENFLEELQFYKDLNNKNSVIYKDIEPECEIGMDWGESPYDTFKPCTVRSVRKI